MRDNVGLDQAERSLLLHRQSAALRHNAWLLREEVAAVRRRLDEVNTWLVSLRSHLRRHFLPPTH